MNPSRDGKPSGTGLIHQPYWKDGQMAAGKQGDGSFMCPVSQELRKQNEDTASYGLEGWEQEMNTGGNPTA